MDVAVEVFVRRARDFVVKFAEDFAYRHRNEPPLTECWPNNTVLAWRKIEDIIEFISFMFFFLLSLNKYNEYLSNFEPKKMLSLSSSHSISLVLINYSSNLCVVLTAVPLLSYSHAGCIVNLVLSASLLCCMCCGCVCICCDVCDAC